MRAAEAAKQVSYGFASDWRGPADAKR